MLLFCPLKRQKRIRRALKAYREMPFRLSRTAARSSSILSKTHQNSRRSFRLNAPLSRPADPSVQAFVHETKKAFDSVWMKSTLAKHNERLRFCSRPTREKNRSSSWAMVVAQALPRTSRRILEKVLPLGVGALSCDESDRQCCSHIRDRQ